MALDRFKMFTGNANRALAKLTADYLGVPLARAEVDQFDDKETNVHNLESARDNKNFIFQSSNGATAKQELQSLCRAIVPARGYGSVTVVSPHTGYTRSDRKDEPRTPINLVQHLRDIISTGIDGFVGLDFHSGQAVGICEALNPRLRVDHLYPRSVILDHLSGENLEHAIISSTDEGGGKRVNSITRRLRQMGFPVNFGTGYKDGSSAAGINTIKLFGDYDGRHTFFIDDIISSGKTCCAAAAEAKALGAARVTIIITHAVMANDDVCRRLVESPIDEIIFTDTVPLQEEHRHILGSKLKIITVAKLLAITIKHLHEGQSVSSLFELDGYRAGLAELKTT